MGIPVGHITTITMIVPDAFLGLANANEAPGTTGHVLRDVTESIGFDVIIAALFGYNKSVGTSLVGLLLGILKVDGHVMQPRSAPTDMILVLQSVIVLPVAVPVLVRWLFHLFKGSEKPLRARLAALAQTPASITTQPQTLEQISAAKTLAAKTGDEAVGPTALHKEGDTR